MLYSVYDKIRNNSMKHLRSVRARQGVIVSPSVIIVADPGMTQQSYIHTVVLVWLTQPSVLGCPHSSSKFIAHR